MTHLRAKMTRICPFCPQASLNFNEASMINIRSFDDQHTKLRFPDTKLRFLDTKLRFPDTKLRFPDTKLRFPDTKLRFPDTKLRFPDTKLRFPDTKLRFSDTKLRFLDTKLRFPDTKLRLKKPELGINFLIPHSLKLPDRADIALSLSPGRVIPISVGKIDKPPPGIIIG